MIHAVLFALGGAVAHAQSNDETVDFEMFRPSPDAYGYLSVPSSATLSNLQVGVSWWTQYENDPIVLTNNGQRLAPTGAKVSGDDGEGLVDDRVTANLQMGIGISRFFSLCVDVPTVLQQDGYQIAGIASPVVEPNPLLANGLGDIRIQPKIAPLDLDRMPVGLAVAVPIGLPTGNGGSFLGEEDYTVAPTVITEFSDGSVRARTYSFRLAIDGGYLVRRPARLLDVNIGNAFLYGVGIGIHPVDPVEIVGEFHGQSFGSGNATQAAETNFGLRYLLGNLLSVTAGGGVGLMPGIGAPDYRLIGGIAVSPSFDPHTRDSDKDGISNAEDQCVFNPEDLDQYQDSDGCPEDDNDSDGIPDKTDHCINDAEDKDNFQDDDGCPDVDNDKDGLLDVADRCPDEPETQNGYQDDDGCPDSMVSDTDGDGYDDSVDRCPYDPEDFDGVEDEDGCPDSDRVVVEANRIKINDRIYFEFGKAIIQEQSYSLMDEIAAVIIAHPNLSKIRVEGHTDNVGDDLSNLRLSQARADAVKTALVSRGVDAGRLDAMGFGEMHPVDTNDTDPGRQNNRRVEFIIVEQE